MNSKRWPTKKLGEVAKYINGRAFKPSEWTNVGLPIIRIQNLTETQEKFNFYNGKIEQRHLIEKGDILLSWSASLGVYIWDKEKAVLNQHIFRVVPNETIDKKYLFYALLHVIEEIKKQVHGSTMTHITKPVFERNKIPLPPLNIQNQIVERLDAIRKAQELNDKQIALANELKKSLIHNFGIIEKKWPMVELGKCVSFLQLGLVKSKDECSDKGILYLKMDAIQPNGELDLGKTIKVIANEDEIQRYRLKIGDFLFNTRNTPELVGKSTIFEEKGIYLFNNNILRLRFKNLLPSFLSAFFQTGYGDRLLNSKKKGTTSVWAIYQRDLFKIGIPLPPLEVQRQIVEKLQAAQDYKKKLLEQKQKLKELFESCLYRAMKGELVS